MSHRLPLWTAIVLFLDIVIGGLVVGLNAGFACPDWPLCNGHLIPTLNVQVIVEYIHRLTTSILTILILVSLATAWFKRKTVDRWVPTLALLSFVFLVLQIVLGAIIVVFVLPGWFTTIDVGVSMALLSTYVVWTTVCWPTQKNRKREESVFRELAKPVFVTTGITYLQVLVGGFFRHSGAGEAFFGQSGYLASHHETDIPSKLLSSILLGLHVIVAVAVTFCVIWMFVQTYKRRTLVKSTLVMILLIVVQMALGFASLATALSLFTTTAHFAVAALMLGVSVFMSSEVLLGTRKNQISQIIQRFEPKGGLEKWLKF